MFKLVLILMFSKERENLLRTTDIFAASVWMVSHLRRSVPQIEVKFCINSNGILSVIAVDKGTWKKQGITIINLPNDYEVC